MDVKHFLFIRHAKTRSNVERRYTGDPDEPLCPEGIWEAEALARSGVFASSETLAEIYSLICGPALRCRQTADLLFPGIKYTVARFDEIDFGIFIGKNADDLIGNIEYESWLDTNCMGDIPGGGSVGEFKERCCDEFVRVARESGPGTTALIIHGGNIMSIMEKFACPKQGFYEYHISNCGYILCRYERGALIVERRGGA